ncbi:amidohydrolase family protein, partial [Cooperia oncophora]
LCKITEPWNFLDCDAVTFQALHTVGRRPPVNSQIDCVASRNLKRLPGLIDIHVHVREPGATHKEDWYTCTRAALAGGITQILAMPNTNPPLIDMDSYQVVEKLAANNAVVDYGLYVGATPGNARIASELAPAAVGLKMYLNQTFSTLKMDSVADWVKHFESFPTSRPIVCHAEKQTVAAVLCVAQMTGRAVHICHVSNAEEIQLVRDAKRKGWPVTCEVCPHHLLLTEEDLPPGVKEVRPRLATVEDRNALWANLEYIDCFATDHEKAPPGFPGVEYMVPLLLTAVSQGKLTIRQLLDRLYYNPKRIFGFTRPARHVDLNEEWMIPESGGESKAGWTPYAGMKVRGRVQKVVVRGEEAFVDGVIHARPGFGMNIRSFTRADVLLGSSSNEVVSVLDQCYRELASGALMKQPEAEAQGFDGSIALPILRCSQFPGLGVTLAWKRI